VRRRRWRVSTGPQASPQPHDVSNAPPNDDEVRCRLRPASLAIWGCRILCASGRRKVGNLVGDAGDIVVPLAGQPSDIDLHAFAIRTPYEDRSIFGGGRGIGGNS
jgi:hypothetical protein